MKNLLAAIVVVSFVATACSPSGGEEAPKEEPAAQVDANIQQAEEQIQQSAEEVAPEAAPAEGEAAPAEGEAAPH